VPHWENGRIVKKQHSTFFYERGKECGRRNVPLPQKKEGENDDI